MAQLDQILGAVLTGIVRARADADKYSAKMAREYLAGDDPILSGFPVPRATIGAVKIDLRFAIQSTVRSVRFDETGVGVASGALATRVIQLMVQVFRDQKDAAAAAATPAGAVPWGQLITSATDRAVIDTTTHDISQFLFGALGGGVSGKLGQYIDASGNLTNKDNLVMELVDQLDTSLLKRTELAAAGDTVLLQIKSQIPGAISSLVARLQDGITTDLNVIIATEALKSVPAESIMTLGFELSIQDYQWRQEQLPHATAPKVVAAQAGGGGPVSFSVGDDEHEAPRAPHDLPPGYRLVGV